MLPGDGYLWMVGEEEGGRGRNRERGRCLVRRGGVVGAVAELGGRGCQAASKTFSSQGSLARGSPARDWVPAKYLECRTQQMVKNHIYVYDDARQIVQDTVIGLGTAKVGFYISAEFALQASSCTRLKSLRLSFWWHRGQNIAREWGRH